MAFSEFVRSLIRQVADALGQQRRSQYEARWPVSISLNESRTVASGNLSRAARLDGVTCDLSVNGLAVLVPTVRIGHRHLAAAESRLQVSLELPGGEVIQMQAVPARYQPLESTNSEEFVQGYLLALRITDISPEAATKFSDALQQLGTRPKGRSTGPLHISDVPPDFKSRSTGPLHISDVPAVPRTRKGFTSELPKLRETLVAELPRLHKGLTAELPKP